MQAELTYERVLQGFESLKMTTALESLDNVLETARVEELSPLDVLGKLLDLELDARHARRSRRTSSSPACRTTSGSTTSTSKRSHPWTRS